VANAEGALWQVAPFKPGFGPPLLPPDSAGLLLFSPRLGPLLELQDPESGRQPRVSRAAGGFALLHDLTRTPHQLRQRSTAPAPGQLSESQLLRRHCLLCIWLLQPRNLLPTQWLSLAWARPGQGSLYAVSKRQVDPDTAQAAGSSETPLRRSPWLSPLTMRARWTTERLVTSPLWSTGRHDRVRQSRASSFRRCSQRPQTVLNPLVLGPLHISEPRVIGPV